MLVNCNSERASGKVIVVIAFWSALCCGLGPVWAGLGVLDYNVNGIGPAGSSERQALQRIVDYFDPDIITFQEAKSAAYADEFVAANAGYEGFYSSPDGAGNREMIMSKYDIFDASVREYSLGEGSLRPLFAATIHLPGQRDVEVFTAHWNASSASVRANESAASVAIIASYGGAHPGAFYVYAGDFNDVDTSVRITNLLDASVGLVLFTPVDPNNGSSATINSDPAKSTYLDRRIDYILPSDSLAPTGTTGRVLNTLSYAPPSIPSPLLPSDTVSASDHLPIYAVFDIPCVPPRPGDANMDGAVTFSDYQVLERNFGMTNGATWSMGDFDSDGDVDFADYQALEPNFGQSIPEPATMGLLSLGGLALIRRRRG